MVPENPDAGCSSPWMSYEISPSTSNNFWIEDSEITMNNMYCGSAKCGHIQGGCRGNIRDVKQWLFHVEGVQLLNFKQNSSKFILWKLKNHFKLCIGLDQLERNVFELHQSALSGRGREKSREGARKDGQTDGKENEKTLEGIVDKR